MDGNDDLSTISEAEARLQTAMAHGGVADLAGGVVRGEVLRALLIAARSSAPVRLRRAVVDGPLDLADCRLQPSLAFAHVTFKGGVILSRSRAFGLAFEDCKLDGPLSAVGARFDGPVRLISTIVAQTVTLDGARVAGDVVCDAATLSGVPSALSFTEAEVAGSMLLDRSRIEGGVIGTGARVAGNLYVRRVRVTGAHGEADLSRIAVGGEISGEKSHFERGITLTSAEVAGGCDLARVSIKAGGVAASGVSCGQTFNVTGAMIFGAVDLAEARIGQHLLGDDIEVEGGDAGIDAAGVRVGRRISFERARVVGSFRLTGAEAGGDVSLSDAKIFGSDHAIEAEALRIGGKFACRAAVIVGPCDLSSLSARSLVFDGATIKVESGPALTLANATIAGDVACGQGFETIGAVTLQGAEIGGLLSFHESRLKSAAIARGVTDRSSARTGAGLGTIVETSAHVSAYDAYALDLAHARIGWLRMPAEADRRPRGVVDLSHAHAAIFEDFAETWPKVDARSLRVDGTDIDHLRLDGFRYDRLVNPNGVPPGPAQARYDHPPSVAAQRIDWLDGQTKDAARRNPIAGPWLQLASCVEDQGYAGDGNAVRLVHKRRASRAEGVPPMRRALSWLADVTSHFGTSPLRPLTLLAGWVIVAAIVWASAASLCSEQGCGDETILVKTAAGQFTETGRGRGYPDFHPLAYALDTSVPVLDLGYAGAWWANERFGPLTTLSLPDPAAVIDLLSAGEPPTLLMPVDITIGALLYAFRVLSAFVGALLLLAFAISLGVLRPARS